jgi:hypothetical protein
LRIAAEIYPQAYTAAFGFFVRAGARDEDDKESWPDYEGLSDSTKQLISDCDMDSGGCELTVIHDKDLNTFEKSKARLEKDLVTGERTICSFSSHLHTFVSVVIDHFVSLYFFQQVLPEFSTLT